MASIPAAYKPSPLGYGSPRSSPFRRPESPASPSPLRHPTPTQSPSKVANPAGASPRFSGEFTASPTAESWTARGNASCATLRGEINNINGSIVTIGASNNTSSNWQEKRLSGSPMVAKPVAAGHGGNALSKLQPAQVRMMREVFQILDRDSDGVVNRDDVADMLSQLGLPAGASDVTQFFPPAAPQTMTLPAFLSSLATSLASLSQATELLSAFSAFDEDDSGQVDVAELRDALLHTAPEEPGDQRPLTAGEMAKIIDGHTGRRAFSKNSGGMMMMGGMGMGGRPGSTAAGLGGSSNRRGEVFRYQEFVASILGGSGNGGAEQGSSEDSEEA